MIVLIATSVWFFTRVRLTFFNVFAFFITVADFPY